MLEAMAKIARIEAENKRLEEENQWLLGLFVTWAYSAHTRELSKEFLSQPLPRVDRGQSVAPNMAKARARGR